MKLLLATVAVGALGLLGAGVAAGGGDPPPEECVPVKWHPCPGDHGTPPPHPPTCENGGTVVWINRWHFICVVPPEECNYERRIA